MHTHSIYQPFSQALSSTLTVTTWHNNTLNLTAQATHWGFVYQGNPQLNRHREAQTFTLYPGMYFCLPGQGSIGGKTSCGMVISCEKAEGMFSLGGPVETKGRFAYIDGGANSLLIPPMRLGDPCLNALYFPPKCDQTMHTHPSYRICIVLNGTGEGETPDGILQLHPGLLLMIPPHSLHKFRTTDSDLALVVFHPDSDTGFTHRNNPMLNRTLVAGVSAAKIPEIQTSIDGFDNSSGYLQH